MVETGEGPKRIEDIRVGDLVQARDKKRGVTLLKPVVQLFRRRNRQIFDVLLSVPNGRTEVIGATAEHPFHVRSRGWVPAAKLASGQIVDQLHGEGVRVLSVKRKAALQDTYNFEVADAHSYFVGNAQAWVHNACDPPINRKQFYANFGATARGAGLNKAGQPIRSVPKAGGGLDHYIKVGDNYYRVPDGIEPAHFSILEGGYRRVSSSSGKTEVIEGPRKGLYDPVGWNEAGNRVYKNSGK